MRIRILRARHQMECLAVRPPQQEVTLVDLNAVIEKNKTRGSIHPTGAARR